MFVLEKGENKSNKIFGAQGHLPKHRLLPLPNADFNCSFPKFRKNEINANQLRIIISLLNPNEQIGSPNLGIIFQVFLVIHVILKLNMASGLNQCLCQYTNCFLQIQPLSFRIKKIITQFRFFFKFENEINVELGQRFRNQKEIFA